MTFDRDDDGWTNYDFPEENTIQDVIDGLKDEDNWIDTLTCDFNDENFSTTQGLREAIMSRRNSNVFEIKIFSSCVNQENRERSLDFFLRYLDDNDLHPYPTFRFDYQTIGSWTLAQAQKSASVITSLRSVISLNLSGDLFDEEGTFECVFGAVLDGGVIKRFSAMTAETIPDLKRGCIGRSNLANNTTLEELDLNLFDPSGRHKIDEVMEHLANALKSNRRLATLSIEGAMMTNVGRRYLMESMCDNATLVQLRTRELPCGMNPNDEEGIRDIQMESRIEREDGQLLQSQIDRHTKLNRFWKRYASRKCKGYAQLNQFWTRYASGDHNDCGSDGDHKEEYAAEYDREEEERLNSIPERTLSLDIYPDVLEVLAKKPLLLFMFLREEHPQLFRSFDRRPVPRQRRRSERLLKKRRITAPGSVF